MRTRPFHFCTASRQIAAITGVYDGKFYRSLSAVARAITGAHWGGTRFFGLTRKAT